MYREILEPDICKLANAAAEAANRVRPDVEGAAEQMLGSAGCQTGGGHSTLAECSRRNDLEYHLQRARSERNIAYRAANQFAADAHMRLSALHLHRALLFQAVRRAMMGNVHPSEGRSDLKPSARRFAAALQLRSIR
jgi:hypothetical protein